MRHLYGSWLEYSIVQSCYYILKFIFIDIFSSVIMEAYVKLCNEEVGRYIFIHNATQSILRSDGLFYTFTIISK
jgi:hypothetical protein